MNGVGRPRLKRALVVFVWAVSAAVSGTIVLFVTSLSHGACYDSGTDPTASYCTTSGPPSGGEGAWILWGLWAVAAAIWLRRIIRTRSR